MNVFFSKNEDNTHSVGTILAHGNERYSWQPIGRVESKGNNRFAFYPEKATHEFWVECPRNFRRLHLLKTYVEIAFATSYKEANEKLGDVLRIDNPSQVQVSKALNA